MPSSDKYTDPKLRDEIKEEIQQSDKGGQPGQWSARKAQMMASEYKKRGGGYTTDKSEQDSSQKNLEKWGDEEWQTKDGEGKAKQEDGTEKRYLPKKAWEQMSEEEKKQTDDKKQKESKKGKQFVANTDKAKEERKKASEAGKKDDGEKEEEEGGDEDDGEYQEDGDDEEDGEEEEEEEEDEDESKDEGKQQNKGQQKKGGQKNGGGQKQQQQQQGKKQSQSKSQDEEPSSPRRSQRKRSTSASDDKGKDKDGKQEDDSNKKSKTTHGSKHDSHDPPNQGKPASSDRLPEKGQEVHWKAMPGWVSGVVQEILTSSKKVDGKQVKASKDDPRISLKSNGPSGKIAIHKPAAVYF